MKTFVTLTLAITAFLVISSCRSHAAIPQPPPMPVLVKTVQLTWDYDMLPEITGFKIYWRDSASPEWTDAVTVGRVQVTSIPNIPTFRTTHFICTALAAPLESGPSNTVTNKAALVPPILREIP